MADAPYDTEGLSEETAKLAALGRGEAPATETPTESAEASQDGSTEGTEQTQTETPTEAPEVPEWFPKKFLKDGQPDYEALGKSYAELEKKQGAPKEEAEEAAEGGQEEASEEGAPIPAELFKTAQGEYAETGKLSDETYATIAEVVGQDTLDLYLQGVAAVEAQMERQVFEYAGGEEAYREATAWAQDNWSAEQISAFNDALGNEALRKSMIRGLMADYREAVPGEGRSTERTNGVPTESLYHDKEEFTRDLAKAEEANDLLARREAVRKLERSKKAGTIDSITPRSGLKRFR